LEVKFGEADENGHPLRLHNFFEYLRMNIQREIDRTKNMAGAQRQFQNSMPGVGGVGGGGFGGGGAAVGGGGFVGGGAAVGGGDRFETQLAKLRRILENAKIGPSWFAMSQTKQAGGTFIVPDLDGSRRAGAITRSDSGVWDPDALPPSEPIIPVVQMDSEIWLPRSAGIQPGDQRFSIRVSYRIDSVDMADTPPLPTSRFFGDYGSKDRVEDGFPDDGRYAILQASIESAKILHPRTGEPLIDLDVRPAREPQALDQR
jgi:hypothetical protein